MVRKRCVLPRRYGLITGAVLSVAVGFPAAIALLDSYRQCERDERLIMPSVAVQCDFWVRDFKDVPAVCDEAHLRMSCFGELLTNPAGFAAARRQMKEELAAAEQQLPAAPANISRQ